MLKIHYVNDNFITPENDGQEYVVCDNEGNVYFSPYEEEGDCLYLGFYLIGKGINYMLDKLAEYEEGKNVDLEKELKYATKNYYCFVAYPEEYDDVFYYDHDEPAEEYVQKIYDFIKKYGSYKPIKYNVPGESQYVLFAGEPEDFVEAAKKYLRIK